VAAPRPALALLLALLSPLARAAEPDPSLARPRLTTENGIIRAVDLADHALTVEGDGGAFTVALDRNTLVYLPGGLASVADLRPGARVRVGRDGPRASWVEVREPASGGSPPPASPQRPGPGGTAPPPADAAAPADLAPQAEPGTPPPAGAGADR
jgi:hypothetical protein